MAARRIRNATYLLVTAGAGFSADSGLPVYKDIADVEAYRKMGLDYSDLCEPSWIDRDPGIFYGFWGHCVDTYRKTAPHEGYRIVKKWRDIFFSKSEYSPTNCSDNKSVVVPNNETATVADEVEDCDEKRPQESGQRFFVYTSNVDNHFVRAGYDARELYEIHGSVEEWQCSTPKACHAASLTSPKNSLAVKTSLSSPKYWPLSKGDTFDVDTTTMRLRRGPPFPGFTRCTHCGAAGRPSVLMFRDDEWTGRRDQERLYVEWEAAVERRLAKDESASIVVIEMGCGERVPHVRRESEMVVEDIVRAHMTTRHDASKVTLEPLRGDAAVLPQYVCAILLQERKVADNTDGSSSSFGGRRDRSEWFFLMERRGLDAEVAPGELTCFGGKVEDGETTTEAICRELKEELGWNPPSQSSLSPVIDLYVDGDYIARFFATTGPTSHKPVALEEGRDAVWIRADEIVEHGEDTLRRSYNISPWHACVFDAWAKGRTRADFFTKKAGGDALAKAATKLAVEKDGVTDRSAPLELPPPYAMAEASSGGNDPLVQTELKRLLTAVYTIANPDKLGTGIVQKALVRYAGYEDILAERLLSKYEKVAKTETAELVFFVNQSQLNGKMKRRKSQAWAKKARRKTFQKLNSDFDLLEPVEHEDAAYAGRASVVEPPNMEVRKRVEKEKYIQNIHKVEPSSKTLDAHGASVLGKEDKLNESERKKRNNNKEDAASDNEVDKSKMNVSTMTVYQVANPQKLDENIVQYAIDRYKGYEDVLAYRLATKYKNVADVETQNLFDWVKQAHSSGAISRRESQSWASKARKKMPTETNEVDEILGLLEEPIIARHRGSIVEPHHEPSSAATKRAGAGSAVEMVESHAPTTHVVDAESQLRSTSPTRLGSISESKPSEASAIATRSRLASTADAHDPSTFGPSSSVAAVKDDDGDGETEAANEPYTELRALIGRLYAKVDPAKLESGVIDKALGGYRGYEDVLAQRLNEKYKDQAPDLVKALLKWTLDAHENGRVERRTTQVWAAEARAKFAGVNEDLDLPLTEVPNVHRGSICESPGSLGVKANFESRVETEIPSSKSLHDVVAKDSPAKPGIDVPSSAAKEGEILDADEKKKKQTTEATTVKPGADVPTSAAKEEEKEAEKEILETDERTSETTTTEPGTDVLTSAAKEEEEEEKEFLETDERTTDTTTTEPGADAPTSPAKEEEEEILDANESKDRMTETATTKDPYDELRDLLGRLYADVNPAKLDSGVVDKALDGYRGYEDVLVHSLSEKYEDQAPDSIEALNVWVSDALGSGRIERRTTQVWAEEVRAKFADVNEDLGLPLTEIPDLHRGSMAVSPGYGGLKADAEARIGTETPASKASHKNETEPRLAPSEAKRASTASFEPSQQSSVAVAEERTFITKLHPSSSRVSVTRDILRPDTPAKRSGHRNTNSFGDVMASTMGMLAGNKDTTLSGFVASTASDCETDEDERDTLPYVARTSSFDNMVPITEESENIRSFMESSDPPGRVDEAERRSSIRTVASDVPPPGITTPFSDDDEDSDGVDDDENEKGNDDEDSDGVDEDDSTLDFKTYLAQKLSEKENARLGGEDEAGENDDVKETETGLNSSSTARDVIAPALVDPLEATKKEAHDVINTAFNEKKVAVEDEIYDEDDDEEEEEMENSMPPGVPWSATNWETKTELPRVISFPSMGAREEIRAPPRQDLSSEHKSADPYRKVSVHPRQTMTTQIASFVSLVDEATASFDQKYAKSANGIGASSTIEDLQSKIGALAARISAERERFRSLRTRPAPSSNAASARLIVESAVDRERSERVAMVRTLEDQSVAARTGLRRTKEAYDACISRLEVQERVLSRRAEMIARDIVKAQSSLERSKERVNASAVAEFSLRALRASGVSSMAFSSSKSGEKREEVRTAVRRLRSSRDERVANLQQACLVLLRPLRNRGVSDRVPGSLIDELIRQRRVTSNARATLWSYLEGCRNYRSCAAGSLVHQKSLWRNELASLELCRRDTRRGGGALLTSPRSSLAPGERRSPATRLRSAENVRLHRSAGERVAAFRAHGDPTERLNWGTASDFSNGCAQGNARTPE
eukprot:g1645.t1